mgnify:FL=1|tara:strand:+ start:75 stop:356 length:282 start_codon:yes stop_codon:yes gene_type:complete
MKNGGISTIYNSNRILHKVGTRKGKTKDEISKIENDIKHYKSKKKVKHKKKVKPKRKVPTLKQRVHQLEIDNRRLKKMIVKLIEHTKLELEGE